MLVPKLALQTFLHIIFDLHYFLVATTVIVVIAPTPSSGIEVFNNVFDRVRIHAPSSVKFYFLFDGFHRLRQWLNEWKSFLEHTLLTILTWNSRKINFSTREFLIFVLSSLSFNPQLTEDIFQEYEWRVGFISTKDCQVVRVAISMWLPISLMVNKCIDDLAESDRTLFRAAKNSCGKCHRDYVDSYIKCRWKVRVREKNLGVSFFIFRT